MSAIDDVTGIDYSDGNRYWLDDVDLVEICERHVITDPAAKILNAWDGDEEFNDWYALDELKDDGTMLRVTVGALENVQRVAQNLMFGDDDAGAFETEPFYRFKLINAESARLFFAAVADDDAPAWAGQLMSVSEVAAHTGRTRQAVLELIKRGRLHADMIMGEWRVLGQALREFKPYTR